MLIQLIPVYCFELQSQKKDIDDAAIIDFLFILSIISLPKNKQNNVKMRKKYRIYFHNQKASKALNILLNYNV